MNKKQLGPATTCHIDAEGRIVKTNSRFDGMQPADFVGLKLEDFLAEPSRSEYLKLLRRAVQYGEVGSYQNVVESPKGAGASRQTVWYNRVSPWREGNTIVGAIMIGNQLLDDEESAE